MPYMSRIISRGIPEISDGRVFVVETINDKDGSEPFISPPDYMEWAPDVKIVGIAGPGASLLCPECNEIMERKIMYHTDMWMYTVFACPRHHKNILLDFFPKVSGDTCYDFTNAFMADIDPISNPRPPAGVIIENHTGPGEYYQLCLKHTERQKSTYYITPDGVLIKRYSSASKLSKALKRLLKMIGL